MITVELDGLKGQSKDLAEFLSGPSARVKIKGSTIYVDGGRSKDVKLAVHKFLRHHGLDSYRVIAEHGALTVLPPKKPHRETNASDVNLGAGVSPFSPYRMNPLSSVEFPNYSPAPARKYKQPKKK